jgi:hypothetical protein
MGQIVTFYSYKGGTGRSMALANVAWALASNRQKVLVIDWDLEAPGLHRYFRAFLSDKELTEPESKGLIEFVRNYAMLAATPPAEGDRPAKWYEPHAQIWKWATPLRWPRGPILNFANRGEIQFVPAGRQGPEYAERINTFDWHTLYQAHGGDKFFESVREQAKREFDYVLIDSRTGVSDTSGICTIQMPDILVVCYTYNFQSIMGASDIARRILNKRPGLTVFPVAMRVEFTETDSLIPMRKLARERFGDLVTTTDHGEYFDKTEVPYYPKYSFFERLAAFEEFPNAKGSINSDVRHLAFLIAGSEMVQAPIDESRRRDVALEFDPTPAKIMRPMEAETRPVERLGARTYGIVAAAALLLAIALLLFYVYQVPKLVLAGVKGQLFYLLLLPWALLWAGFLYSGLKGYARVTHGHFTMLFQVGGPVLIFFLAFVGGFYLIPQGQTFDLTIRPIGPHGALQNGKVDLDLGGTRRVAPVGSNGEATFKRVPQSFWGSTAGILIEVEGYEATYQHYAINRSAIEVPVEPAQSHVTILSGTVFPVPGKQQSVEISVVGQDVKTKPDASGAFLMQVAGQEGDRIRLIVSVDGKVVYDEYQILPGPLAVRLNEAAPPGWDKTQPREAWCYQEKASATTQRWGLNSGFGAYCHYSDQRCEKARSGSSTASNCAHLTDINPNVWGGRPLPKGYLDSWYRQNLTAPLSSPFPIPPGQTQQPK